MVKILHATVEDVERLLECEIQVWENLTELLPDSFINPNIDAIRSSEMVVNLKRLIQNKEILLLIAIENNNIIGLAKGRINLDGVGMLGFLGVRPNHRNKGVGSSLLEEYLKEAKKRNAHKVWLFTSPSLYSAIRLDVRAGFVPEGYMRRHSYGLDLIFYSKFLT